jgi:hypothetical protein
MRFQTSFAHDLSLAVDRGAGAFEAIAASKK